LMAPVEGVNRHSSAEQVAEFLEAKASSGAGKVTFVVEDDHASFSKKDKLASICNRLQHGPSAMDTFMAPTVRRAFPCMHAVYFG
jgi:hypothetical protein